MNSKTEAEATLAKLPLEAPVVVSDIGIVRREYRFTNRDGSITTVEIDADPTDAQLADLARHLPLADKDREAAFETIKSDTVAAADVPAAEVTKP
jgi:hypothetical protein